ncbi:hypothetical protein [Mucilaginibacter psychrotolerans]|uniref:Uncharacterized protein n=1 Tax=Mucilaginibacter psychrotolerans TaxID=1524096 RepID=A0A4Y8SIV9_9SPHI|nr:hypothetical protein [Mucilaginibacter psychrotolerans]TFF38848.1 hypothetical protein E2R66_07540 [Mucilaginibacter psychrotolerans]
MKRLVAILLISIHLFNAGGYMLVQQYQVYRTDKRMNELISQNLYNPNALIEVKIAQHLPGITETWGDYKNIDGQVQLKNACYNYVKLKVTRDTLYLMVIQNYEKTKLIGKNIIYAKQINDIPQGNKDHDASIKKGGLDGKYSLPVLTYQFASFKDIAPLTIKPVQNGLIHPFIPVAGQPPEYLA